MMKEAAITQARVVGALVLRETRVRYGRSKIGYLWALLEPFGFIAALSIMFTYIRGGHAPYGNSMPLFFALGIVPFMLYRGIANQLGSAFESNEALLSFPIVKEVDTIFARILLEAATMVVIMTVVLAAIYNIDKVPLPDDLFKMLTAFIGLVLFGSGIGLCNAVITTKFASWGNVFRLFNAPSMFLSGIFYSLESMPMKAREVIVWNPIIHGVEAMRDGYFTDYRASSIDLSYLYWWGVATILIGLAGERAIRIRSS